MINGINVLQNQELSVNLVKLINDQVAVSGFKKNYSNTFKKDMNLKDLFTTIYSVIIILLITLCVIAILMYRNNKKLDQSNIDHYKSFVIADELRQSSDDLTRYCRTYVATGDSIWEEKYWEVLDIRNGKSPRPDGRTIALQDSMRKLGFTKPEFDKLKESERNSNDLVWTEKIAFHAMKGLFADDTGLFSIHNTADTIFARTIMFDEKYHYNKSIIMQPIDDFMDMVKLRTQNEVEKYTTISNWFLGIIIGLILIISVISIISFFFIKDKIIKQLEELREAKIKAEESKTRFKALHDASFGGILVHEKGIILECNQGLSEMTGYTIDELIGMDGLLLIAESSREYVMNNVLTDYEKPYETIGLRKNGEEYPMRLEARTIPYKNKQARTVEFRDITEQKKAEQTIKESEGKFKDLNATKDKFFSIIAHDLRSPFNSILGFSILLIDNLRNYNVEVSEKYSKVIHSSAQNTLNLLDNLLNWAKSQTGEISFEPEKTSLNSIIQEIIEVSDFEIKNISLTHIKSDDIEVFADQNMLKTILRNLVSNALKFTKSNGKIDIYTLQSDNNVEIMVSDNGIGMTENIKNNLFQLGKQESCEGTAGEKGSGLGLVLCKEFVERHGGRIWVESELGKGSVFKFTMPVMNLSPL